jgi:hypothetical protein
MSTGPLTQEQLKALWQRKAIRVLSAHELEAEWQSIAVMGMELAAQICMDLDLKRGKATHDYLDCVAAIRERARK